MHLSSPSHRSAHSIDYTASAKSLFFICALALICASLSLAAGARSFGIGRDFFEYLQFYETITPYNITNYSRFEIGFEAVSWFFGYYLNLEYKYLLTFLVFISLAIKFYLFTKYLKSPFMAVFSYILLFYPIHEYTQIRAAVAIAFAYLGLHFALNKKFIYALLFFLAGISFHSSIMFLALICGGIFFIPKKYHVHFGLFTSIILLLFSTNISDIMKTYFANMNPLISSYLENTDFSAEVNLFSGTNIFFALALFYCLLSGMYKKDQYNLAFFIISLISFIWIFVFREAPVVALRTAYILFLSFLFLAYKEKITYHTAPLQLLVLLAASWGFYRSVAEGIITI